MIELLIKVKQVNDKDGLDFKWVRFYAPKSSNKLKVDKHDLRDKFGLEYEIDIFYYSPIRFKPETSFSWDSNNSIYYLTNEYDIIDFDCVYNQIDKWIDRMNNII